MTLTRIASALALLLTPLTTSADPVSIIALGAQAAASGALGAALTISAATATWVGIAAAGYGMIQARRQQRKAQAAARAAQVASLQDRNYRAISNIPPRATIYGTARTAGYPVDVFATDLTITEPDGSQRVLPDGLKHMVIVWSARECTGIWDLHFDGDVVRPIDIGADGWVTGGAFARTRTDRREVLLNTGTHVLPVVAASILSCVSASDTEQTVPYTLAGDGRTITIGGAGSVILQYTTVTALPMLRVSHHLGGDSQTVDSYLASVAPTRYTSAHRLRGLCYSVLTLDLRHERWQSGIPNPLADIDGVRCYDPRSGTSVFTFNPALHLRDYLTHSDGWGAAAADIDDSSVIAAANACEQTVLFNIGGSSVSQMRYTSNGVIDTSMSREQVLDDLARAMAGTAIYSGLWRLSAGVYTAPVLDLTDDDLAGAISITQTGAPDDQLINGVRGVYMPQGATSAVDMEPYVNAALLAADVGERWQSLDLPFTDSNARCRNIARIECETRRNGLTISYPGKLHLLRLQPGDRVRVTASEGSAALFTAKVFRVTDAALAPRGVVQLTLQEDGPDAWDEVDSAADPTPNTSLPSPFVMPALTGLTATSGTAALLVAGDGTVITRVRVAWDPVSAPYAEYVRVRWTLASGGTSTTISVPISETSAYIVGPVDGQIVNVEAWVQAPLARGDSRYVSHTVIGKTEPPPQVVSFSVQEMPSLGRQFVWDAPDEPPDSAGFEARYLATTAGAPTPAWGDMTPLFEAPARARNYSATGTPPEGLWAFAIRAVDTTGNVSPPRWMTALLDAGGIGAPIITVKPETIGWPGLKVDCVVDGSFLVADGTTVTWDQLTTWSAWTTWATTPATVISYRHDIDIGAITTVSIRHDSVSNAVTTTEYQRSDDGATWTAWGSIPASAVTTRYLRVRWTVSGSALPTLYRATVTIYA